MANIDELTVEIKPTMEIKSDKKELWEIEPVGKQNVAKCIQNMGKYIIDNAEKIAESINRTVEINIHGNICVNKLPTVEVSYINQILDTTMCHAEKSENNGTTEK